jgi:CarD family transcriptional regulator
MATTKKSSISFTVGESVVYPAHGVGRITALEEQEVAGFALQVFVVYFEHNKMTLRIPVKKAADGALRKIAGSALVEKALEVLSSRAQPKRGMWSRRAQELEVKIKSGELLAVAEVVRDLYRAPEQAEPSYSERTLYEAAVEILGREIAAVHGSTSTEAQRLIEQSLAKALRPMQAGSAPEMDGDEEDDAAA